MCFQCFGSSKNINKIRENIVKCKKKQRIKSKNHHLPLKSHRFGLNNKKKNSNNIIDTLEFLISFGFFFVILVSNASKYPLSTSLIIITIKNMKYNKNIYFFYILKWKTNDMSLGRKQKIKQEKPFTRYQYKARLLFVNIEVQPKFYN